MARQVDALMSRLTVTYAMNWLRSIFGRVKPVAHFPREIRFLGEQEGAVECDIKSLWIPILAQRHSVRRAYLAIVAYDDAGRHQVALCISSTEDNDLSLVKELMAPFRDMFNKNSALDIMFLRPEHEMRIREVCRPFYEAV